MGLLTETEYRIGTLVLYTIATPFTVWVLQFVFKTVKAVLAVQRQWPAFDPPVLFPCVFKSRVTSIQFTMWCTVASVAFFVFEGVFSVFDSITFLALCHNCKVATAIHVCHGVCLLIGYALMFVTHFERVRLAFGDTSMRLPNSAPKVLYANLTLYFVLMAAAIALQHSHPIVAGVCGLVLVLIYCFFVCAFMCAFYRKTLDALSTLADPSAIDNMMQDSAVRVILSVCVSLVSTAIAFLFWITRVIFAHGFVWLLLDSAIFRVNVCLNAFCLMCTLRRAVGYYQRVFGKLHASLLKQMHAQREVIEHITL